MQPDSSIFEETISEINILHLSHSNIFMLNLSSVSRFQNDSITTSYDFYQHVTEIIVYKYICLTIFIIGVIGNLLSVLVFSRASLRHRSCAIYFLALAITDIASLFASFIDTVLPSYNNVSLTMKSLFICKLNPLMVYFTTDLSNFLLAVASIDRAVSIQYPLKSKQFCRARIAIYIIIIMALTVLFINGHIFWGFELIDEQSQRFCSPSKTKVIYYNEPNSITYDRFYAIFDSLDMLFAVVFPFVVMLICNLIILIRVITSRRSISTILTTTVQSKRTRKRHEKERQLTVMLLGSAAAFLVFTLPTEINDTVRAFRPSNLSQPKGAMALMTAVFIAMEQLNHAIHFYIYTLTGRVFRNELIQLFTLSKHNLLRHQKSSTMRQINHDHSLHSFSRQKSSHYDN
ncbi:unnamed protein product [Rotaria magnacalcarata]|uniref:G-protein coupled receptors family 1 profile domain-containing protein n=3 Tax=Rotaria magnacalcarata TaxID=392030 RepID=A0A816RT17_9BILA|nr:unnamed protein product [Rotaria magnacalcarata]CAF1640299.1 unnamed protein product [Rotaria magnacalcarata]CAF2075012.1 unnamed protein product [Rotaria magnacalcarata]CAF2121372.1 unnamed protein product [Rotaria magnacalcarata]CAF3749962.1 unnamed protein product [Rotaria magnacalcarata]